MNKLHSLPVFFRHEMAVDQTSYSPSAGKPRKAVGDWIAAGLPIEIRSFEPVTRDDLALAHNRAYVDGVLDGVLSNGFGNKKPLVNEALLYTSGAMVAAARHVVQYGGIACAPVSGFHHAGWNYGRGFCTFNGLMVAALMLAREGLVRRVGVFDCDQHYGDGTDDILGLLSLDVDVIHDTVGGDGHNDAGAFLRGLRARLEQFRGCDVLLYQAGADPHNLDPLGGWLTTAQLAERDRIVFEWCVDAGVPVAWDLAGGYQVDRHGGIGPVLEIHRNTADMACRAQAKTGPLYSRTRCADLRVSACSREN